MGLSSATVCLEGNQALVDDVRGALIDIAGEESDRRIRDIVVQLKKFCTDGMYKEMFNKPSMLNPNAEITTLEMAMLRIELGRY